MLKHCYLLLSFCVTLELEEHVEYYIVCTKFKSIPQNSIDFK